MDLTEAAGHSSCGYLFVFHSQGSTVPLVAWGGEEGRLETFRVGCAGTGSQWRELPEALRFLGQGSRRDLLPYL